MDSEKSQGSILKAVLQAKESNRIQGIYGRMGDLGAIDGECNMHHVSYLIAALLLLIKFHTVELSSPDFNG